jgi:hypothetical protein
MSDIVKIVGIICLTLALCVSIAVLPNQPQLWGTLLAMLGAILGIPALVKAIKPKDK